MIWTGVIQDVTAQAQLLEMAQAVEVQTSLSRRLKLVCSYLSHEVRNQLFPQAHKACELKDRAEKALAHLGHDGTATASPTSSSDVEEDLASLATEAVETSALILDGNATVTAILDRVLDLAKWESGKFPVHVSFFPLLRLFKSLAAFATAKGGTVLGLDSVGPTWRVKADEHLLKQACTNLISNAAKFCDATPVVVTCSFVRSATEDHRGDLVVVVKDGGRGMTAEQLKDVLVPFAQIRKAEDGVKGTGLGLSLTREMVESGHEGGTLTLTSPGLGQGTTATIRIALLDVEWASDAGESAETAGQPAAALDPLGFVALVVDDVPMNRKILMRTAQRLGLTAKDAKDGKEALATMLSDGPFSLVFMDKQMPVMNGDEATERARAAGYTGAIVMVSGDSFEPDEKVEMAAGGVTAFLSKLATPGARDALKLLAELKQQQKKK